MPILIGLGAVLFIYLYIKFKSFRSFTNDMVKKSPEMLRDMAEKNKKR